MKRIIQYISFVAITICFFSMTCKASVNYEADRLPSEKNIMARYFRNGKEYVEYNDGKRDFCGGVKKSISLPRAETILKKAKKEQLNYHFL